MPNKKHIDNIKKQLPAFVEIQPESYKGARYKAKFIDLEYNEPFEAVCGHVIKLQHGCKSRSNKLRSEALQGIDAKLGTPIEHVISQLPDYLEIVPESYKSVRSKANFYDKEYKCYFEAYVCNVLRDGKGYCKERQLAEFKKQVTRTPEDIQRELDAKFPGQYELIPESYKDTNSIAEFIDLIRNTHFKAMVCVVLSGKNDNRRKQADWKLAVKTRDSFTCQVCQSSEKVIPHHLYSWVGYPEKRFDPNNGITLCPDCHNEFHGLYGKGQNTPAQFLAYLKQKGDTLSSIALEIESRFNSY